MAMLSKPDGPKTFGYEPSYKGPRTSGYEATYKTVRISLHDALNKVIDGDMRAMEVFDQMPPEMKGIVDEISRKFFLKSFSSITESQQKTVLKALLDVASKLKNLAQTSPVSSTARPFSANTSCPKISETPKRDAFSPSESSKRQSTVNNKSQGNGFFHKLFKPIFAIFGGRR